MKIDYHTHPAHFKNPEKTLRLMVEIGLEVVVATEHVHLDPGFGGYLALAAAAKKWSLPITVLAGAEVSFDHMDHLVYGLPLEDLRRVVTVAEAETFVVRVRVAGGVVVQAHPFRTRRRSFHRISKLVDGYEEYNGNNSDQENHLAAMLVKATGGVSTRGSDTHRGTVLPVELYADIPGGIQTEADLGRYLRGLCP